MAEVRHVPDLKKNLISSGTLDANGCKYASEGVLKICKGFFVLMKGLKAGSLYMLEGSTVTSLIVVCSLVIADDTTMLWHMRLGHMSEKGMDALVREVFCVVRILESWNYVRIVFASRKELFSRLCFRTLMGLLTLDCIHLDFWGPSRVLFIGGGAQYLFTFIYDYSRKVWIYFRKVWIYFLKHKDDELVTFKQWKKLEKWTRRLRCSEQIMG